MKILVLNYEYPPLGGGASPVSKDIAEKLADRGNEVTVVTMHFKGLQKEENINGVHIIRISCWRSKKNICHPWEQAHFLWKAWAFLQVYLKTRSFDIVHCHFLIPTGILAVLIKNIFRIPFVVTIHGSDIPGFNPDRFQLLHKFTRPLLRKIALQADLITSPSIYLKDLFLTAVASDLPIKLKVIYNGIEKSKVQSEKKNIILSTGRLLERKGFFTLVSAVAELESNYVLHICGDGPAMSELKILAHGSKTSIIFHGWMDNRSVEYQTLLAEASIYCLVSSHENASIAILEAMENGCAVITSNTTGCFEMVHDVGLCINPSDKELLKSAIEELIEHESMLKTYSKLAKAKVEKMYRWNGLIDEYEKSFYEIISVRSKPQFYDKD